MSSVSEVGLRIEKILAQNLQKQSKKAERTEVSVETLLLLLMDIKNTKIPTSYKSYLTNKKL
jgi:hypothetical protein